jgi:uncharacterized membrane protein
MAGARDRNAASPPLPLDRLIAQSDQERVVAAIRSAEATTSGQIQVHLEEHCPQDPRTRAEALFVHLGLGNTRERNGVLIYVAVADHKYAILGDAGIHGATEPGFWQAAAQRMTECFAQGKLAEGLITGIAAVGAELAARFPPRPVPVNELPDEISTAGSAAIDPDQKKIH